MMVHWGLYCIPAGDWKGETMGEIGEWAMSWFRIPIAEYEQLAKQFNPVEFDADEWMALASRAGMKYLVFTAKHHDGFAMYHSKVDPYNIVDATPFGRDPIAELAAACSRHGVKLCLYYSQAVDWHERDAGGAEAGHSNNGMSWCNDWDFPDHEEKRFERYLERKSKPQLRELLTRYGPIGAIWFDTPWTITRDQCQELYDLVRSLQPDCIMNSRLGQGLGDYQSLGDNMIAHGALEGYWETVATMNDTWGYKRSDHSWKSTREILTLLTGSAGKNVNYVLNIGPMSNGRFPDPSVGILRELGDWMQSNSESIHATDPTPFSDDLPWGPVTHRTGKLYVHLQRWPGGVFRLNGLHSRVQRACFLSDRNHSLSVRQHSRPELHLHALEVDLPAAPPHNGLPVLALEFRGKAKVEDGCLQQPDGTIALPVHAATVHRDAPGEQELRITPMGMMNLSSTDEWLSWSLRVFAPGQFAVKIISTDLFHSNPWQAGYKVRIAVAGAELQAVLSPDEEITGIATHYYKQAASACGMVTIPEPGLYELHLRFDEISREAAENLVAYRREFGLVVDSVQLVPARDQS